MKSVKVTFSERSVKLRGKQNPLSAEGNGGIEPSLWLPGQEAYEGASICSDLLSL